MSGRPSRRRGSRGAVLVETALTVGVILTILLFSVQLGLLGFLQLTYDAASFVDARLAAVDVATPGAHANATHAIFSQVAPAQIVSTVAPAPSPSVPVDYGYNSTNATTQTNSITNRHGGTSMMLPTRQTSTIAKPAFFTLFGKKVGVASQSIDALWLECGIHVNVSNGNAGCSPAAVGAGSAAYAGSYFTAGENAPPYFVGLDHIHHCNDPQPWTTCSSAGSNYLALGTAVLLGGGSNFYRGNWSAGNAGAGGSVYSSTFSIMACHQRQFAIVAAALAPFPTLYGYYSATSIVGTENGYPFTNAEAIYYQMHNLDGNFNPPTASSNGYNSFKYNPWPTAMYQRRILDWNDAANSAVSDLIYYWDQPVLPGVSAGVIGLNQTNPDYSCP